MWGEHRSGWVIDNCIEEDQEQKVEVAMEKLNNNLTTLEILLENKNINLIQSEKGNVKDEEVCAKVARKPEWLKTLKKFVEIVSKTLKEAQRQESIRRKRETENGVPTGTLTQSPAAEPGPEPTPQPAASPAPQAEPGGLQTAEATTKQELPRATEKKPKEEPKTEPQGKPEEMPPKPAEDPIPTSETDETNSSFLNNQKWLFWAALLI
ncbi:unnamed protein product [Trypanosoma congolense IL3000]|uniref:WGS project CAEQ00000000 data, annotated contig 234 n=1 Tax=Trypanosoma congolense (strain IL3000) TaxID=1068625 RepID=F9WDA1_TRYCI|nr:unnamed protein product [Trypanosoma congolense IL3000]